MKSKKRILYIFFTVLWMMLIFYFSSIPDLKSSLPTTADTILRKLAHMLEYAVLYYLQFNVFVGVRHRTALALLLSILYAVSDEWHQSLVIGRIGSPVDVGIDTIGIVISLVATKRFIMPRK